MKKREEGEEEEEEEEEQKKGEKGEKKKEKCDARKIPSAVLLYPPYSTLLYSILGLSLGRRLPQA